MPDIFLSYRRGDTAGHAGRVYDGLKARFRDSQIFMDVDSIPPGEDFVERIQQAVASCDVVVVLIGDDWLEMKAPDGTRRLDNPEDFVRLEIAAALDRGVSLVPVLVEGATPPSSADLPDDIKPLARRHAVALSDERWEFDAGRLIQAIDQLTGGDAGATQSGRRLGRLPVSPKLLAGGGVAILAATVAAVAIVAGRGGDSDQSRATNRAAIADTASASDKDAIKQVLAQWFESSDPDVRCKLVTDRFLRAQNGKTGPAGVTACAQYIGDDPPTNINVLWVNVNGAKGEARFRYVDEDAWEETVAFERVGPAWKIDEFYGDGE